MLSSLPVFCHHNFSYPQLPAPAIHVNKQNSGIPQRILILLSLDSVQAQGHLHIATLFRFYPTYYNGSNVKLLKVQMR